MKGDTNYLGIATSGTAPNPGYTLAYNTVDPIPDPYSTGANFFQAIWKQGTLCRSQDEYMRDMRA